MQSTKRFYSSVLTVLVLFMSNFPASAQISEEGGSGLLRVQRAVTSGKGQWSFGAFSRYYRQDIITDEKEKIHNLWTNLNATWALTDEFEITATVPAYGWLRIREDQSVGSLEDEGFDEFQFGDISAKFKMSLPVFTPRIRFAAEGFMTFPTGSDDVKEFPNVTAISPFTSDTYSYGVRGLLSLSTQHSEYFWPMLIHANVGIRLSDDDNAFYYHSYPKPFFNIPRNTNFTNELLDAGAAVEFPFLSNTNFFAEIHTEQLLDLSEIIKASENPIYAGAGLKIQFAGKSELTFAALKLLSEDDKKTAFDPKDSFSDWQAVIGISLSAGIYGGGDGPRKVKPARPMPPVVVVEEETAPTAQVSPERPVDYFGPLSDQPKEKEEKRLIAQVEAAEAETVYVNTDGDVVKHVEKTESGKTIITHIEKAESGKTVIEPAPQTFQNPMVVVNVGSFPGMYPTQPMQYVDEQGKVHTLQPQMMGMPGQPPVVMSGPGMMPCPPVCAPGQQPMPCPPVCAPGQQPMAAQPMPSTPAPMAGGMPDSLRDADNDGYANYRDRCPWAAEVYNGFMDDDGCPDTPPNDFKSGSMAQDTDGDGIADHVDKCVTIAEDWDGFEDFDGCPELDNDRDGISDSMDRCPNQPETFNGVTDQDGCPEGMEPMPTPQSAPTMPPVKGEVKSGSSPSATERPTPTAPQAPAKSTNDSDSDGIQNETDKCQNAKEDFDGFADDDGCPDLDNDGDGIPDAKDKCPNAAETFNNVKDKDGCPDETKNEQKLLKGDQDKDNIPNERDQCVTLAEDWDGYKDDDGCPDVDNDNDGLKDKDDKCPNAAENFNGVNDADGCPDEPAKADAKTAEPAKEAPKAELKTPEPAKEIPKTEPTPKIESPAAPVPAKPDTTAPKAEPQPKAEVAPKPVLPPANTFSNKYVYFDASKADYSAESKAVIDYVAGEMRTYPILKMEVAGYADASGDAQKNLLLSENRAVKVKNTLVEKGVDSTRLTVKGYGEENPIASNDTLEGRKLNRRVEFHIAN